MTRRFVARAAVAAAVIAFFAWVRPGSQPPMGIVAALALGAYEAIAASIKTGTEARDEERRRAA